MLIDDVKIRIKAGNGGKGAVAFNHNMMSLGPTGGTGGNGASVFAMGVSDLSALNQFKYKKIVQGEDGHDGRKQFMDGNDGENLTFKVPVGTVITNLESKAKTEITKIGERVLLGRGGRGGKGNFHFRSSKNTSPKEFQPGLPGDDLEFQLELKLIADIGFVGLPNVGKSSLLNELTNAKSKVANYSFTTLEPNLGVYYELILADIPGLIENSSSGKGLGIKFLRHIERTRILFHFISAESLHSQKDYEVIRRELGTFNKDLLKKTEYLFLTKSDILREEACKEKLKILKKINPKAIAISVYDLDSIKKVQKILNKIKAEK
ncbi:MAG: GTPase ObgE [Patescibacteria group bacterium]